MKIAKKLSENNQLELAEKYFIRGKSLESAFRMYINNDKLREASRFVNAHLNKDSKKELYLKVAAEFYKNKEFTKAEQLYVTMGEPERAIKLYKNLENWDKMLQLFAMHRPESLKNAHLLIGRKHEEKENLKQAEKHFIEGGKWTSAVDMYEKRKMFEDCIRICKNYASDRDTVERAKRWDGLIDE